jgi:hypothetical protein
MHGNMESRLFVSVSSLILGSSSFLGFRALKGQCKLPLLPSGSLSKTLVNPQKTVSFRLPDRGKSMGW